MKIQKYLEESVSKGNILFIVANNDFEDTEYEIPRQILLDGGYSVITSSKKGGRSEGVHKKILLDNLLTIKEACTNKEYKAIVLVGGPGAEEYWRDSYIHTMLKIYNKRKAIIAAICIAPVIIARSGLLRGKKGTVHPDHTEDMGGYGVDLINESIVIDGNIVTANGPEVADKFGKTILKMLGK